MEFVTCKVSAANVKVEPSHESELYTQLLFGHRAKVLDTQFNAWMQIELPTQDHGFVLKSQFTLNTDDNNSQPDNHLVWGNEGVALNYPHDLRLYPGSRISSHRLNTSGLGKVALPESITPEMIKDQLLIPYLNVPYMWGGMTTAGIDCSGLSKLYYSFLNIALPHGADAQITFGTVVDFVVEARLGDLAFFVNEENQVNHVGILLSPHEILHASEVNGYVAIDSFDQEGIINKITGKRTHQLRVIKRL